jgi:hypothetical protein
MIMKIMGLMKLSTNPHHLIDAIRDLAIKLLEPHTNDHHHLIICTRRLSSIMVLDIFLFVGTLCNTLFVVWFHCFK